MAVLAEKQLGQIRPGSTTAEVIYTPTDVVGIVKNLIVCNTSSSSAKFRFFQDADGTTYDETTAIFWDVQVQSNETIQFDLFLPGNAGNYAVRTDTADALTFTLSGAEVS